MFAGSSTAKTLRMLQFMNVASICERTFYCHTSSYMNPVIIQQWKEDQQQLLDSLCEKEDGLVLAGDCSMHALRTFIVYLGFPMIHSGIKGVGCCVQMAACLLTVKLCLI